MFPQSRKRVGARDQGKSWKAQTPSRRGDYIPEQMAANGFSQLEIGFRHAVRGASLDWHHRDPFDRLLIAQALDEDLPIVYGVRRIW